MDEDDDDVDYVPISVIITIILSVVVLSILFAGDPDLHSVVIKFIENKGCK